MYTFINQTNLRFASINLLPDSVNWMPNSINLSVDPINRRIDPINLGSAEINECIRKLDFYFFVHGNIATLNIRAIMKRTNEITNGPPIPATYDSPTQNNATEITITNIQTKAIIKFLLSIVIYLPFEKFCVKIYAFPKRSFTLCANTIPNIPKNFVIFQISCGTSNLI